MSTKPILQIIIAVFVLAIIGVIYYFRSDFFSQNGEESKIPTTQQPTENTDKKISVDRVKTIEQEVADLKSKSEDQDKTLQALLKKQQIIATPEAAVEGHNILATAQTQSSVFTTTSTSYTPMGLFLNISCPEACTLWINFYTVSKNTNSSNNVNSYDIFLNGQNRSIYTEANFPEANGSLPLSLNTSLSVSAGTHTVEMQAKTSGGTLESDISSLQVMAIEQ